MIRCLAAALTVSGFSFARAAVDIQFDYTYDTTGFFSGANMGRRAVLEAAAAVYEARLTQETPGAIVPGGGNTWSLIIPHPGTGVDVFIQDPVIPAGVVRIYLGARDLSGSRIAAASYGYEYSGGAAWVNSFESRNSDTNFDPFGGVIAFDSPVSWYSDNDLTTLEPFPGQHDLFTVALHEIGHLMGFTSGASAFDSNTFGGPFAGTHVIALTGGPVPVEAGGHWAAGVRYGGAGAIMLSSTTAGTRRTVSELDWAAFQDLGYNVTPAPLPARSSPRFTRTGPNAYVMDWYSIPGAKYRVQTSVDFTGWIDTGSEITADNSGLTTAAVSSNASDRQRFWRARRVP